MKGGFLWLLVYAATVSAMNALAYYGFGWSPWIVSSVIHGGMVGWMWEDAALGRLLMRSCR